MVKRVFLQPSLMLCKGDGECDRGGDYRESEELLLKALEMMSKCCCHGEEGRDGIQNSIAVARVKDSLGKLYTLLSRYDEARRCLNESLAIRRNLQTLQQSSDLSGEGEQEQEEDKEEEDASPLSSLGDISGTTAGGAEVGDTYTLLAELALTQHNWSEAERTCLKSIEIYEKYFLDLCPHHPKLLNSKGNLGLIYLLSKKRAGAGGEGRDCVKEGERLIDESLRRLLYGNEGDGK